MTKTGFVFLGFILFIIAIYTGTQNSFSESSFVSTDKPMYLDGQEISVSGFVSNFKTYPVTIEIVDPLGDSINSVPIKPDNSGEYITRFETGSKIWKNDGVYKVIATHASVPDSQTITFEYFHKPPKPIPPNAGPLGEEHANATIIAKIYGKEFDFSKPKFQMQSPWIRFEDNSTVHRYAEGVTLGFFFDNLGIGQGTDECYKFQTTQLYCSNAYYTFKFNINGNYVNQPTFREYVIEDGDKIIISYDDTVLPSSPELIIPQWIKDVAGFWCNDAIDTASFVGSIEYLIQNKIIVVPLSDSDGEGTQNVPSWIKTNACWWANSQITDNDFASGLEYLIKNGIIVV